MLIVYLPQERIVINADLYPPPARGAAPPANISQSAIALLQQHPAAISFLEKLLPDFPRNTAGARAN
jgi:hypothetical protein